MWAASSAHMTRGTQLLLDGEARRAAETLEEALSFCRPGIRQIELSVQCRLAQARLAAGDAGGARTLAETCRAHALEVGARRDAIEAAIILAQALRVESGLAVAAHADEVLASAERLIAATGARNLEPFLLVERAAWSALRGDREQQQAHLRGALEGFERIGAGGRVREVTALFGKL